MSERVPPKLEAVPTATQPSAKGPPVIKAPGCSPADAYNDVTEVLRELQKARGRALFVLVSEEITNETCEEIYEWRAELKAAGDADRLDVLLHSPGGDLTACYQIARLLCRRANAWEALIPCLAASGATLIALGSSNLVMSEVALMSPLDPQVLSKRNERFFASERQSPLEAFSALRYLREFAVASLDTTMQVLLKRQVAPKPALETASSVAHHIIQPISSKIDPYDLGAFALDNTLSLEYCQRVGRPEDPSKKTQRSVKYRSLVEKYPVHEFVVDLEEARSLGFCLSEPEPEIDALFDRLRPQLGNISRYVGFVPESEA